MLYVSLDTNRLYRFNGTIFVVVSDLDATVYQPAGSVLFANLPAASAGTLGFVYDIQDDFVTTSDFIEGAGKAYSAGTNVVVINHGTSSLPIYKYDVLSSRSNLPAGGTTGQALVKHSNSDGDVEWKSIIEGQGYTVKTIETDNYNNANMVGDGETKFFYTYWAAGASVGNDPHLPNCESNQIARYFYTEMTKASDGLTFTQRCRVLYTKSNVDYVRVYDRRCTSSGGTWTYPDWIEEGDGVFQQKLTAGANVTINSTTNVIDASVPIVVNEFDKANLYSTDEKVVGCWTDGKPIYQKTFQVTLPNCTTDGIGVSGSSKNIGAKVDKFISMEGNVKNSGGSAQIIPSYMNIDTSDPTDGIKWIRVGIFTNSHPSTPNVIIPVNSWTSFNGCTAYITIRYTKTTDAANSFKYADENDYSTTEHIVGTWIDGKPIYQKTIDTGALPNATTKNTAHSISNLKAVISVRGAAKNPTTGANITIPWASASPKYVYVIVNSTNVEIGTGDNRSAFTSSYVTIQYTKTTD
jgi:hypothetical protein